MSFEELVRTIIPIAQVVSILIVLIPIIVCIIKKNKINKQIKEANNNEELLKEIKIKKDNLRDFVCIYALIIIGLFIVGPFLLKTFGPVEHHDTIEERIIQNKMR